MKLPLSFLLALVTSVLAPTGLASAQTVTTLYNFDSTHGAYPETVTLAQGRDGNLYGTTFQGGSYGAGVVFRINPNSGVGKLLFTFDNSSGSGPYGGLTLATDGNFYGTTAFGGGYDAGVLFRITRAGSYTVLHTFTGGTDDGLPYSPPIEGTDGNLYGDTSGALYTNTTVYKYTPSGTFTTIVPYLHGYGWLSSQLMQSNDGALWVTSEAGGQQGCGTIEKMTTTGLWKATYSVLCLVQQSPSGPLLQAVDGNYYGVTFNGDLLGYGTLYEMTKSGTDNVLLNFPVTSTTGSYPVSGLVQGSDANFYGTTWGSPAGVGVGTLYQYNATTGSYSEIYQFTNTYSQAALVQHTNGKFYGTTVSGGTKGYGTIFSLDMGLGPFVTFVRSQGHVGAAAQILGQGLTGSTGVTFNGVPATSFSVVSDTYMTAVVPSGASTGPAVVTTPSGPLASNVSFRISQ
jgi:uncharacterized repeat protein (TIGR03803 family)